MPAKRTSHKTVSTRVFGQPSERRKRAVRAGLYARVSTHDQQDVEVQRFFRPGRFSEELGDLINSLL